MTVPAGYKQAANGDLVPISKIRPIDLERDDLIYAVVDEAVQLKDLMAKFKANTFANIAAFVQLSAEQYGAKLGGEKGNVTLTTFDGKYKIQRAIAENISFDERLQAAKALIDQCIHRWSDGANDNIILLINNAFRVDKEGKISVGRVLELRKINITDDDWQRAMDAIGESVSVIGTKAYVRIYERVGDSDEYQPIALDMASV